MSNRYPLLNTIDSPEQLRELSNSLLLPLCLELRAFLLEVLNQGGGHLSANLGTVELAVALHYVFHTPCDRLVWDTGHQAYVHKILTGRKDRLATIRQKGGLSPFLECAESQYDVFGVGHAGTSVSAALGMAIASQLEGSNRKVVAVIGDGAITAGMAWEALNHAGDLKANVLVVLNDNEMSISKNVGALSKYLTRLLASKYYISLRETGKRVLEPLPILREFAGRTEERVKGLFSPGSLFEELGFHYIGPVDGHNLFHLISILSALKDLNGPRLLHVITKKGKGFPPAEQDPIGYHSVSQGFREHKSSISKNTVKPRTYSQIFGEWVCEMASLDSRLVAITPAMCEGSDLVRFSREYPNRYFDVGIAEQHAVTLAAGLASEGLKPIVAIYSTFLQRAYDQLIHDVALQNLAVLWAIDRGGLVGGDGKTHHGSFDLSYLRCIPNMVIMAASDPCELRHMLYTGFQYAGPCAVRYPRGACPDVPIESPCRELRMGKAEVCRQGGKRIALLAFGSMLQPALQAALSLDATVVNMRFIKPLDELLLTELVSEHDLLVSIEENSRLGGAGSAVSECLHAQGYTGRFLCLGLPDLFISHGDPHTLLGELGLDASGIVRAVESHLADYPI